MTSSELIGSSPRFQTVLRNVDMVAPAACAVMVQGETGTGKEVIARAMETHAEVANGSLFSGLREAGSSIPAPPC
jgi:transcriptional regulator with GAF, ATPase, and Fis domain